MQLIMIAKNTSSWVQGQTCIHYPKHVADFSENIAAALELSALRSLILLATVR